MHWQYANTIASQTVDHRIQKLRLHQVGWTKERPQGQTGMSLHLTSSPKDQRPWGYNHPPSTDIMDDLKWIRAKIRVSLGLTQKADPRSRESSSRISSLDKSLDTTDWERKPGLPSSMTASVGDEYVDHHRLNILCERKLEDHEARDTD